MATLISYEAAWKAIERMEAECGCELPDIGEKGGMLKARAERLLACDDPPKGDDLAWCERLLEGEIVPG